MASERSLVWFRRDLRLSDNLALATALAGDGPVTALYIDDAGAEASWAPGGASRWYLHHSLLSLQRDLAAIGVPLVCRGGTAARTLPQFVEEERIGRVYWNDVVEPAELERDESLHETLENRAISVTRFHDDSLLRPAEVAKKDGTPFRVFTPFWRHAHGLLLQTGLEHRLRAAPNGKRPPLEPDPGQIDALRLLDGHPWQRKLAGHWQPGEATARKLLFGFLERCEGYDEGRDYPALPATSRLSPALHFGELSIARVFDSCQTLLLRETRKPRADSLQRFLTEIGWREFARHVLHAFPQTPDRSLDNRFEALGIWESDKEGRLLQAWQRGETGIALVDAGMRELWETGWMHNRVRMVAASFLAKNLGIHWRSGARWFWDTLVDADLANNTLGWQWVAGCGTDAAPYFRVFNPDLQAKKFDPRGEYLRRWLGDDIRPPAIVDLKLSRTQALERYQNAIRRTG